MWVLTCLHQLASVQLIRAQVLEYFASEPWPSSEPSLGHSGTYGEVRPSGVRRLLERNKEKRRENK